MRALATPRSGLSTIIGSNVPVVMSAKVSAVPSTNIVTSTTTTLTASVAIVRASTPSTTARTTSTSTTISRRSWRSATTPAYSPNSNHGRRCNSPASATNNGLLVWDATNNGPAARAIPSPRLLIHDDESSQRNPCPIRCGATASITLLMAGCERSGAERSVGVMPRHPSSDGCRRARSHA